MHNAAARRPQNGAAQHPDGSGADAGHAAAGATDAGQAPGEEAHGACVAGSLPRAIASVGAMIRLAEGIAAAGRPIDLQGLDDTVGRICAQALDLPAAAGARLRAELAGLVAQLDRLSAALRRR